jgi:hypothetical protein
MLSGDGILRLREVKQNGAVFENNGVLSAGEEVFEGSRELFGGHGRIVAGVCSGVCDE